MARNGLAGKKRGKSKTARYYQDNPAARRKKKEYDTKYHSTPERKRYRAVLQAINRDKGTHGNHDNKDEAHQSKNKTKQEHYSKNRKALKKFFKNKK
jgi:hypothetical protein